MLRDAEGEWVLCDFGSVTSTFRTYETSNEILMGEETIRRYTTPAYRAPEVRHVLPARVHVQCMHKPLTDRLSDLAWEAGVLTQLCCRCGTSTIGRGSTSRLTSGCDLQSCVLQCLCSPNVAQQQLPSLCVARAAHQSCKQVSAGCSLSPLTCVQALGCLLYYLLFSKLAFDPEAKLKILNGEFTVSGTRPPAFVALLRELLVTAPARRPGGACCDIAHSRTDLKTLCCLVSYL